MFGMFFLSVVNDLTCLWETYMFRGLCEFNNAFLRGTILLKLGKKNIFFSTTNYA